jgi:RNA polymerase sigma factor (TIGR02999 family)
MTDITQILEQIEAGAQHASDQLLPLVYDELRRQAAKQLSQEPSGQTLQPTALVHEAYVRLVDHEQETEWRHRGHFYAAAAEAMRRILVENARRKSRLKRGGDRQRVDFDLGRIPAAADDDLIALDSALDALALQHPRKAELVKLRYFGGMRMEQAAESLGISLATAKRDWSYARVWLLRELAGEE